MEIMTSDVPSFYLPGFSNSEKTCDKEFIIRRAATNRVLNVLRHWVSKHSQVRPQHKPLIRKVYRRPEPPQDTLTPTCRSLSPPPPPPPPPPLSDGGALLLCMSFLPPGSRQKGQLPPRGHQKRRSLSFHII